MRKFLEQSAIFTTPNNESYLDYQNSQNVQSSSYVDGVVNSSGHQAPPFHLNVSRLNQKQQTSQLDSSYSPNRLSELASYISEFNYSSPPLADTQILRVLENQLHKKRDQL